MRISAARVRRPALARRVRAFDDEDDELLLEASAAVELALDTPWWLAAADAHLASDSRVGPGSDRIGWWLGAVRPPGVEPQLVRLVEQSEDVRLPRLAALARPDGPVDPAVHAVLPARLRAAADLGARWWQELARHVAATSDRAIAWEVVALADRSPAADAIRSELGRVGDERAAVELISNITQRLAAGGSFTRPWLAADVPASPARISALAALAETTLDGPGEALRWAAGMLQQTAGPEAVAALSHLAALRPGTSWLASARDDAAQVHAAAPVRARLPDQVRAAAAAYSAATGDRSSAGSAPQNDRHDAPGHGRPIGSARSAWRASGVPRSR